MRLYFGDARPSVLRSPKPHARESRPPAATRGIEHAERNRRNGEEVHCRDGFSLIPPKGKRAFHKFRISWCFAHPAGVSSFGNIAAATGVNIHCCLIAEHDEQGREFSVSRFQDHAEFANGQYDGAKANAMDHTLEESCTRSRDDKSTVKKLTYSVNSISLFVLAAESLSIGNKGLFPARH